MDCVGIDMEYPNIDVANKHGGIVGCDGNSILYMFLWM